LASTKFIKDLRSADSEKLIESIYHDELRKGISSIGGVIHGVRTLYGTDGIIDGELRFDGVVRVFRIIIETKKNETFSNIEVRSKVLAQVIYYLKRFDTIGDTLPNIVFVGDKDECFVIHSNYLQKYLYNNYDWNIPPSRAGTVNVELVTELMNDQSIISQLFVFEINDNFDFSEVTNKIRDLALNIKTLVKVNERNILKVFDYFSLRVLKHAIDGKSEYTAREQEGLFMNLLVHQNECYLHPIKRGVAVFNGIEARVNVDAFKSFINHYEFNYNAIEKKNLTAISDRLIEDSDRRRKGDFYTPVAWVDEAHRLLTKNLGVNWYNDYIVWDCAWGTGNLTRDYKFSKLYCSTLYNNDIVIGGKYNNEAQAKFQYDFLNDDVELFNDLLISVRGGAKLVESNFHGSKLWQLAPNLIRGMLNGEKVLFFINPPFGTAGELSTISGNNDSKTGIARTAVNQVMTENKQGRASQQLYAQFIYRIIMFKELFTNNISIGIFSPPLLLTGLLFQELRKILPFSFVDGMLFKASEFADVSKKWGVSFTIWKDEQPKAQNKYDVSVKELTATGVATIMTKELYNLDNSKTCSDWIKEPINRVKTFDAPQMKSPLKWDKEKNYGKLAKGAIGYYVNKSNIVEKNDTQVYILSSCATSGLGISILPENFDRVICNFTARRLITGKYANWVNAKDEYMIPNTEHPLYNQWKDDSIVYSIFNNASYQSSLRNIRYNNTNHNVYNQFFFMSKEEMKQLALGEHHNDDIFYDIEQHGDDERFVYKKLLGANLSLDAKDVLDFARELVRESFRYRELFNRERPEYHINTWDSSWYQIKGILKAYMPDKLKEFNAKYKNFEDRMRPLVVELGFLYDYPGYIKNAIE